MFTGVGVTDVLWLWTGEKVTDITTTTPHYNLNGVNTAATQNHPLNSRDATCPPPLHRHTAHPSWDTSPTAVQFLPSLPSTTPRLLHSDFPKCALRFYKERTVSTTGRKSKKTQGKDEGRSYTHEDPGSGMMWLPRAPTQAILSWATVMPLRFAIFVRPSTSRRL